MWTHVLMYVNVQVHTCSHTRARACMFVSDCASACVHKCVNMQVNVIVDVLKMKV